MVFLSIAIIGGPLVQIINSICNRLSVRPEINTIIICEILVFQIADLVSACIAIHKRDKFRKRNNRKSI